MRLHCALYSLNRIGGVMVSVLASSAIDRMFEPRSGKNKDYKIGSLCFSAKHAALTRKSKDGLALNQEKPAQIRFHKKKQKQKKQQQQHTITKRRTTT